MVIDDNGVKIVTVNLTCGPNHDEARLPLSEMLTILEQAKTFDDVRRAFFMSATLYERRYGAWRTRLGIK